MTVLHQAIQLLVVLYLHVYRVWNKPYTKIQQCKSIYIMYTGTEYIDFAFSIILSTTFAGILHMCGLQYWNYPLQSFVY